MQHTIVFINVGWMRYYQGQSKHDPIRGGHLWLKQHGEGHEAWNFKPSKGRCFGYVPGFRNIAIRNFVGATAASATGITVVWVAKHPELRRHVIVGYYENATILHDIRSGPWTMDGDRVDYQIVVDAADAHLVDREQRTYPPPRGPAIRFGRSPIYYGNPALCRAVAKFIASKGAWQGGPNAKRAAPSRGKGDHGGGRQGDPDERRRIENAAMDHAEQYYRTALKDPHCVKRVPTENRGWDLEVRQRSGETLLVEVKGTSGTQASADLTVNEYAKMRATQHRRHYVVYIVTQAGTRHACAHIFRCRDAGTKTQRWQSDDGRKLEVTPRMAARVSAKPGR